MKKAGSHFKFLSIAPFLLLALSSFLLLSSCAAGRKAAAGHTSQPGRQLSEQELRKRYAAKVAAAPGDIDNIPLYRFIHDWYGTPYRYGGNGKNGVDCSGFSVQLYSSIYKKAIPRTAQLQYNASRKVRKGRLREGDLVFFKEKGKKITHVGVYLTNRYFVHASTGNGVMISNLDDDYWEAHFVKGGKL